MEKSEAELRKKLREANLKLKKTETELGSTRETVQELQQDLDGVKQKLERSSQRMIEAEQELSATKEDLVKQKRLDEEMLKQRLEEEKAKWQETLATAADLAPPSDGDITHSRKSSLMNSDRALSSSRPRSSLMLNNYTFGTAEPSLERGTPMRQSSFNSTPSQPHPLVRKPSNDVSIIASPAEGAPSIHPLEADEYPPSRSRTGSLQGNADQAPTPASYNATHAQGVNDLISASTVGAGPSVQLVERMSATVRRLESERSASRDELARLTIQRDEARQEVVMLMREVEEKRKCDERIRELETTLEDLDKRYNTTLELLGEKSEMVEELHADVAELKRIYRELVDSTMK
ncbi:hypothetical protein KEM55_007333 [Ascosphaera atra]|nr:hypothetical protein KEM55_007333 [Ascosphaera atra]